MNYPKIEIKKNDSDIQINPSKIPTVKELEAIVRKVGVRAMGSFENRAIYIGNTDDLRKYDFYLTVDNLEGLVLVLAKK